MVKNKLIFMVREYNHLDQLTPIIETLIDRYIVIILMSDQNYDYNKDMNLEYLKNKYEDLRTYSLYNVYLSDSIVMSLIYKLHKKLFKLRDIKISKYIDKVLKFPTVISNIVLCRYKNAHTINLNTLLETLDCDIANSVLVTDFGGDELYEQILIQSKAINLCTVGILHGLNIYTNKLLIKNQLSYEMKNNENFKYADYLNYMVPYCSLGVETLKNAYQTQVVKLPSLRYTQEWIENRKKREKVFSTQFDNYLKIVYMVSSENYNIWTNEEYKTMKMISLIEGIVLVIKPHPRTLVTVDKMRHLESDKFIIVDNNTSSSALVDWCDIVMFTSSSILLECLVQKKKILYMRYLHCNSINLEKFKSLFYDINTRDDVLITIEQIIKKSYESKMDNDELKEYLFDYILNNNFKENQEKYLDLFERLHD